MATCVNDNFSTNAKGAVMEEILIFFAVIAVYILLQTVILPKMGIST